MLHDLNFKEYSRQILIEDDIEHFPGGFIFCKVFNEGRLDANISINGIELALSTLECYDLPLPLNRHPYSDLSINACGTKVRVFITYEQNYKEEEKQKKLLLLLNTNF